MKTINHESIRWYTNEDTGIKVPSATSVLQLLPDDPYIEKWKNSLTPNEYKAYMDKIFYRGDIIHKLCENHFASIYDPIPIEPEYQPFITGFHRFLALYGNLIKPCFTEEAIYSAYLGIAGRVDFICEWDGVFTLVDWKTSSSSRIPPSLVDHYRMQTAIYVKIWNTTHERQIRQAVLVPLTSANKKGLGVHEIINEQQLDHYWHEVKGYILDMNLVYNDGYLPPYFLETCS